MMQEAGFKFMFAGAIVFNVALFGGIAYVAIHFIQKFW